MPDWLIWIWIGPLFAVLLALRLRPAYLVILGLGALAGFTAAFKTQEKLYPDCLDRGCPPGDYRLGVLAAILFLLGAALLVLALAKRIFRTDSRLRQALQN
jgi:hypothetical protein